MEREEKESEKIRLVHLPPPFILGDGTGFKLVPFSVLIHDEGEKKTAGEERRKEKEDGKKT